MKTLLAAGILLAGIAAALLFRHNVPRADPPTPGASERLVLRRQIGPPSEEETRPKKAAARARPAASPTHSPQPSVARPMRPAILTPMDPGQPPPDLAQRYPHNETAEDPRWGTTPGAAPPENGSAPAAQQVHRVTDGDTLEALARRYLGSADRAAEIYEANRGLLSRPDLLPIGAQLKIPPRQSDAPPSEGAGARPLAPIPPAD